MGVTVGLGDPRGSFQLRILYLHLVSELQQGHGRGEAEPSSPGAVEPTEKAAVLMRRECF